MNVWLVLLHNTLLGSAHPQATRRQCLRRPLHLQPLPLRARCPRLCASRSARDVTESYAGLGISLETPGFLPYAHGFHHEFALMRPNRWLDNLLGLCFCDHCVERREAAGIDAPAAEGRRWRRISSAYLASDVDFPDDMAEAFWLADMRADGDLRRFLDWRCDVVTSLVAEIRGAVRKDATVAVIPSVARPTGGAWYEGSDLRRSAEAAGIIEACFYEPAPQRVKADLFDIKRRLARRRESSAASCAPPIPISRASGEFLAAVAALKRGGHPRDRLLQLGPYP